MAVAPANAAAGNSIYGTAVRPSHPPQQQIRPTDYLHSIYAPPQFVRQNRPESSALVNRGQAQPAELGAVGLAQQQQHGPMQGQSRPGSDLGLYKMLPSRCQSYTTLPRPEHGTADLLDEMPQFAKSHQQIYSSSSREAAAAAAAAAVMAAHHPPPPLRPLSALSGSRSLGRKNSTAAASLPPAYFGAGIQNNLLSLTQPADFAGGLLIDQQLEHGGTVYKEIVPWSTISLSSWLTIVFGAAIFCLGAVRLYWRADYAKGQELFYGISAICAGLVGFFASQSRSYCLLVAAFLHCSVNVVFIFVPFLSGILPLVPILSSKPTIFSLGGTKEPVEVDIGLAVLSLMQLAAAFSLLLYGCRSFGTSIKHVEQLRMVTAAAVLAAAHQHHQQSIGVAAMEAAGAGKA